MTKKLDPQFVELLRAADEAGIPPIHSMSYKQAREFYTSTSKRLGGESPNNLQVTNQIIETGEYPIPIRLYRPEAASDTILPALFIFMVVVGVLVILRVTTTSAVGWPVTPSA